MAYSFGSFKPPTPIGGPPAPMSGLQKDFAGILGNSDDRNLPTVDPNWKPDMFGGPMQRNQHLVRDGNPYYINGMQASKSGVSPQGDAGHGHHWSWNAQKQKWEIRPDSAHGTGFMGNVSRLTGNTVLSSNSLANPIGSYINTPGGFNMVKNIATIGPLVGGGLTAAGWTGGVGAGSFGGGAAGGAAAGSEAGLVDPFVGGAAAGGAGGGTAGAVGAAGGGGGAAVGGATGGAHITGGAAGVIDPFLGTAGPSAATAATSSAPAWLPGGYDSLWKMGGSLLGGLGARQDANAYNQNQQTITNRALAQLSPQQIMALVQMLYPQLYAQLNGPIQNAQAGIANAGARHGLTGTGAAQQLAAGIPGQFSGMALKQALDAALGISSQKAAISGAQKSTVAPSAPDILSGMIESYFSPSSSTYKAGKYGG